MTHAAEVRGKKQAAAVFLALGSNVGDRLANLRTALRLLEPAGIRVMKKSSVYETEPVGPPQAAYLNAVCLVETHLSPGALLVALKNIEREMGRARRERWGPREIDLDIVLYGDQVIESEDLTVPHPELVNRPFVLIPLLEIDPILELPSGLRLSGLLPSQPNDIQPYEESRL